MYRYLLYIVRRAQEERRDCETADDWWWARIIYLPPENRWTAHHTSCVCVSPSPPPAREEWRNVEEKQKNFCTFLRGKTRGDRKSYTHIDNTPDDYWCWVLDYVDFVRERRLKFDDYSVMFSLKIFSRTRRELEKCRHRAFIRVQCILYYML